MRFSIVPAAGRRCVDIMSPDPRRDETKLGSDMRD